MMFKSLIVGLMCLSGCASVGGVGVNTTFYRTWWKDCGVSRPVPNNIAQFKGQLPSPHTALLAPDEMPPQSSNYKGVLRVVIPMSECNGKGVMVADLKAMPELITPAGVGTTPRKPHTITEVAPDHWND